MSNNKKDGLDEQYLTSCGIVKWTFYCSYSEYHLRTAIQFASERLRQGRSASSQVSRNKQTSFKIASPTAFTGVNKWLTTNVGSLMQSFNVNPSKRNRIIFLFLYLYYTFHCSFWEHPNRDQQSRVEWSDIICCYRVAKKFGILTLKALRRRVVLLWHSTIEVPPLISTSSYQLASVLSHLVLTVVYVISK